MNKTPHHRNLFFGIVLHREKIWVSEFAAIVFVSLLVFSLTAIAAGIITNAAAIDANSRMLHSIVRSNMVLQRDHAELVALDHLAFSLRKFVGKRVSQRTLHELTDLVHHSSRRYGYDPLLLLAVIHVESVFDPQALGRNRAGEFSGAVGLMQLKYETAKEVAQELEIPLEGRDDLFRPEINIPIGIGYLTKLISRFKSFKLGLLAYNQGPGVIRKPLKEYRPLSIKYYNKVLRSYYRLKEVSDLQTN